MEGTSGSTTLIADSLTSSNFNMKDEVDEEYSIVKIEISSQEDEQSTIHQPNTFETGPRRSSRKRKPLIKTLMIDTDVDEEEVASVCLTTPPFSKKRSKKSSHRASSESVCNQLPKPLLPNISKLEKQLGKFLVIRLTCCDSGSGKKSKSRWPNRTAEEWARIKKMTRSERAWERRKKQLEELKKKGIPTPELKPFKPRKKRKDPDVINALNKARNKKYRERDKALLLLAKKKTPSKEKPGEDDNISKPKEKPEDVGICLLPTKQAKTNGIASQDKTEKLKRYHRECYQRRKEVEKEKNKLKRERKRAELLTQKKALTQEDDNDCLAEMNDSWLTSSVANLIPPLPPLSPFSIKSSATTVSSAQNELEKSNPCSIQKQNKRQGSATVRRRPKGTGQIKNSNSKRKKKVEGVPTDLPPSTDVLSLITKNPAQSLPKRLPHRSFQNSKKPTSDSMVDHNRYQMAVRYHLKQKVLQEKALKDSLNDTTPLSIPSLYGTPFDELLEPEKEIVLGILTRFGSKINVEGEWTQKSAERRAAQDSELEQKREKLSISGSSVPCPVCDSCFPGLPSVKEHLGSHFKKNTGQHWIKCKFCKTLCNSPYKMFDHYRYVHFKVKDALCKVCGKGFGGQRLLKIHEFTHWSKEKLVEHGKAVVCSTCGRVIAQHLMRDHELAMHGIAKGEPLLCPVCGEKKYSAFKMDEHIKTHMSPEEQEAYEEKRREEREKLAAEAALKKKLEYSGGDRRKRVKKELKPNRKQRKGKNQAPAESGKETQVEKDDEVDDEQSESNTGGWQDKPVTEMKRAIQSQEEEADDSNNDFDKNADIIPSSEEEVVTKVESDELPDQLANLDWNKISNILKEGAIIRVIPLKNSTEDPEVKEEVKWEADGNHHDDYDDELQRIDQEESSPPCSPVPILIPIEEPRVKRKTRNYESEDDSCKEENDDEFICPSDPDFEPDQEEDAGAVLSDEDFSIKSSLRQRSDSSAKPLYSSPKSTSVKASDAATLPIPSGEKRGRGRPRKYPKVDPATALPKKIGRPKLAHTQEEIQKMRRKWADTSNYNQRMKRKRLREKKFAEEGIPLRRARRMHEKEPEPKPTISNYAKKIRKVKNPPSEFVPQPTSSTKIKRKKPKRNPLSPTSQLERKRSKIGIRRMVPIPLQVYNQAHSLHNFVSSSDLLNFPEYARALEVTSPSVGHGTFEHPHWTLVSSKLHCVCPSCGQTFKDVSSLSLHKTSSHPLIAPCCLICGKPSLCTSTHLVHQTLHSNPFELEEKYAQDVLQLGPPPPNRNDRLYKCSECPKPRYFFGCTLLKRHKDQRHSLSKKKSTKIAKQKKTCSICGKPSKSNCSWVAELHKQTHFSVEEREKWWEEKKKTGLGPKWLQKRITREWSTGEITEVHARPPPKKKRGPLEVKWNAPAICPTCGKVFATIYSLRRHEQDVHTDKSSVRVNCPICGKSYSDKYDLPSHVPTHFGVEETALWEAWSGRWDEFLECVNNGKKLPDYPKLRRRKGARAKPKEPKRPRGRPRKSS